MTPRRFFFSFFLVRVRAYAAQAAAAGGASSSSASAAGAGGPPPTPERRVSQLAVSNLLTAAAAKAAAAAAVASPAKPAAADAAAPAAAAAAPVAGEEKKDDQHYAKGLVLFALSPLFGCAAVFVFSRATVWRQNVSCPLRRGGHFTTSIGMHAYAGISGFLPTTWRIAQFSNMKKPGPDDKVRARGVHVHAYMHACACMGVRGSASMLDVLQSGTRARGASDWFDARAVSNLLFSIQTHISLAPWFAC
jgi:hypothetical protein